MAPQTALCSGRWTCRIIDLDVLFTGTLRDGQFEGVTRDDSPASPCSKG
jgi:hypothetical protein